MVTANYRQQRREAIMSNKLDAAIKRNIEDHLADYIQFGEFDPSLSALECIAHKINTYSDSSSVYEAIYGDPLLGKNLFAMVMEREYFDETETRIQLRKCFMAQASRKLLEYEAYAWRLWEQRNIEPANPGEPDVNVSMPEMRAMAQLVAEL
jgi:hypothetical protein